MTKVQLVKEVASKTGHQKKEMKEILDATIAIFQSALLDGHKVMVSGLGSFEARERKARVGRNPKTGEAVQIPNRLSVKFKPGRELKALLGQSSG